MSNRVIEIHKTPIIWRISARSKVITAETAINHSRLEDPKWITNIIIVKSSLDFTKHSILHIDIIHQDNFNFLRVKIQ